MMSLLIVIIILLLIGGGIWGWPLVAGFLGITSVVDKPSALKHITQLMNTYHISPDEIDSAFHSPDSFHSDIKQRDKNDIAKTLFVYLGAIFIVAGISTYIGMFWDSMGSTMRVAVTLGIGYLLLVVLVAALHDNKYPGLFLPLGLASTIMMTCGWFVLVHELYPQADTGRATTLFVFSVMTLHQSVLFARYRHTLMAFSTLFFVYGFLNTGLDMLGIPMTWIAIILGASLFLVGDALEKTPHRSLSEATLLIAVCWLYGGVFDLVTHHTASNQASLLTGLCVMLAAYGIQQNGRYPRLITLGYFIGSIMIYSGLFDLIKGTPLELIYLAVTVSVLYACVILQSRALLLTTVIAMLGFIGYFSEKYFANSLGWPITLILMGTAFLTISVIAIRIRQRIQPTSPNKPNP